MLRQFNVLIFITFGFISSSVPASSQTTFSINAQATPADDLVLSNDINMTRNADESSELTKKNSLFVLPPLPIPTTANASVTVSNNSKTFIYSFMGLEQSDSGLDVSSKAWKLDLSETPQQWKAISAVPTIQKQKGRFATTATALDNIIYLLGGYSTNSVTRPKLSPNLQNVTDFYSYDPVNDTYQQLADMPVPVDDTVILPYQNRYLYVVSGWHKDGAVNLVQVFDTHKNSWFQASPLLGNGRFGHAAGIIDNQIVVCDGMEQTPQLASTPVLNIQASCLLGEINAMDPSKITWFQWVHPTDSGRFRMAAFSDIDNGSISFIGGSTKPYDINGKVSSSQLAEPNADIWTYHADKRSWSIAESSNPVFDIKNVVKLNNQLLTIGGRESTGISNKVLNHSER